MTQELEQTSSHNSMIKYSCRCNIEKKIEFLHYLLVLPSQSELQLGTSHLCVTVISIPAKNRYNVWIPFG